MKHWMMASIVMLCATAAEADTTFTAMGLLPGGKQSQALGVSANGDHVVGYAVDSNWRDYVVTWTAGGGLVSEGAILSNGTYSHGQAIADNGTFAGGGYDSGYTAQYGFISNGSVTIYPAQTDVVAISADGTVGAGTGQGAGINYAQRYNPGGTVTDLAPLAVGAWAWATDITADGSTIVGTSRTASSGYTSHAVMWVNGGTPIDLGTLSGNTSDDSSARGISPDGSYLTGVSANTPYLWTEATGMVALDVAAGYSIADVRAVSDTGVVGGGVWDSVSGADVAVYWDSAGMHDLSAELAAAGVLPGGWRPHKVTDISADGTVLVGFGYNADNKVEGFVATLDIPEPASMALLAVGSVVLVRRRR